MLQFYRMFFPCSFVYVVLPISVIVLHKIFFADSSHETFASVNVTHGEQTFYHLGLCS